MYPGVLATLFDCLSVIPGVYFNRSEGHGLTSVAEAYIEMLAECPGVLNVATSYADSVYHCEEFLRRVGDHVAHFHTAKISARKLVIVVDVNGHYLARLRRVFFSASTGSGVGAGVSSSGAAVSFNFDTRRQSRQVIRQFLGPPLAHSSGLLKTCGRCVGVFIGQDRGKVPYKV